MSFGTALLDSVLGILVVFAALVLLMVIIMLMTSIGDRIERRPRPIRADVTPVPPEPQPPAPGSAGEVKLYDTDPRTAALIMAIIADELQTPINELRFISIREVKEEH
ncbi:MAG: OadG family protein [Oscillospiraceae bacterium]|nr:OadG family protein [Oscillospiraceae bacterium]